MKAKNEIINKTIIAIEDDISGLKVELSETYPLDNKNQTRIIKAITSARDIINDLKGERI